MNIDLSAIDLSALKLLKQRLQEFLDTHEERVQQAQIQIQHIDALLKSFDVLKPEEAPKRRGQQQNGTERSASKGKNSPIAERTKGRRGALVMVSEYQGCTLTEAVGKVMRDRYPDSVNADDVIAALYGSLSPNPYKLAKDRVTKNLSKGKLEGIWARVPDQTGQYILEDARAEIIRPKRGRARSLPIEPSRELNGARTSRGRSGGSSLDGLPVRSPYQDKSLSEAITLFLNERKGEYINADSVVKALFEDLTPDQFRLAKDRVTKTLSKGKIDGKWERVPEQMGYYTLSLAAVKP
ncbi:MAG: hypothetical protein HC919_09365 [Oscillatoriales cyanobacterium SM2_2_1]|nr:hypothetical protein [Oscillatoriales cyanobacterium SM2_2_1]